MAHRQFDQHDIDAERESQAIGRSFKNTSKDFGLRLKTKYYTEGVPNLTGQRHRKIGDGG